MNGQAGKGDSYRPVDQKKYQRGYDAIFSNCPDHPNYKGLQKPRVDCPVCRRIYRERRLG